MNPMRLTPVYGLLPQRKRNAVSRPTRESDAVVYPIVAPSIELRAGQSMALQYPPIAIGHRQLENVLCQVNRHGCSIHLGLLPSRLELKHAHASAWHDDAAQRAGGVHPITADGP